MAAQTTDRIVLAPGDLRYNQVRQKSSHNSFDKKETIIEQIRDYNIYSIELDVHRANPSGVEDGHWNIYHTTIEAIRATVKTLDEAIVTLRWYHDTYPGHPVITVFLDLQDYFDVGDDNSMYSPLMFDAVLQGLNAGLPPEQHCIFMPRHLQGGRNSMLSAVRADGWPLLSRLRGQFIFVMTNSSYGRSFKSSRLASYYGTNGGELAPPGNRVAFLAPDFSFDSEMNIGNLDNIIFYNLGFEDSHLGFRVHDEGMVSRVYPTGFPVLRNLIQCPDWDRAKRGMIHHIACEMLNPKDFPCTDLSQSPCAPFELLESTPVETVLEGQNA